MAWGAAPRARCRCAVGRERHRGGWLSHLLGPPPTAPPPSLPQKKADFKVEDIETEDGVLVLTADNFDAAIKAYDPLL